MVSESCKERKYEISVDRSSLYDGASVNGYFTLEEMKNHQFINIYYVNNEVMEIEEIPILSLWGFISSCGGSLGLFLGFSCYGTISSLIECTKEKIKWL